MRASPLSVCLAQVTAALLTVEQREDYSPAANAVDLLGSAPPYIISSLIIID